MRMVWGIYPRKFLWKLFFLITTQKGKVRSDGFKYNAASQLI